MSDNVAKSQRDFSDEIERERTTSRNLKDALTNLQVFFDLVVLLAFSVYKLL